MKIKESLMIISGATMFALFPRLGVAEMTAATLPTDSQIAEIVVTVNHAEMAAAELAKKSNEKRVTQFAEHMISAHSNSDREIAELEKKTKLTNRNSTISEKLKIDTGNQLESLKKLKGTEFDKEYISAQIKDHSDVLNLFDKTLIPNAKEEKLKLLLAQTRTEVASHLELAKKVQSEMQK